MERALWGIPEPSVHWGRYHHWIHPPTPWKTCCPCLFGTELDVALHRWKHLGESVHQLLCLCSLPLVTRRGGLTSAHATPERGDAPPMKRWSAITAGHCWCCQQHLQMVADGQCSPPPPPSTTDTAAAVCGSLSLTAPCQQRRHPLPRLAMAPQLPGACGVHACCSGCRVSSCLHEPGGQYNGNLNFQSWFPIWTMDQTSGTLGVLCDAVMSFFFSCPVS